MAHRRAPPTTWGPAGMHSRDTQVVGTGTLPGESGQSGMGQTTLRSFSFKGRVDCCYPDCAVTQKTRVFFLFPNILPIPAVFLVGVSQNVGLYTGRCFRDGRWVSTQYQGAQLHVRGGSPLGNHPSDAMKRTPLCSGASTSHLS